MDSSVSAKDEIWFLRVCHPFQTQSTIWAPHFTWHPLLTALYRNPTDFPIRNSLGISVTLSGYLWQINLCTSSWHLSSSVRPQLKSGNSRRQGVAVTSVSNYPTNQKATLPLFNAGCDQAQLKFSWRWLHAEHFLAVRGTIYIGYSKTIFQRFRKTNTLLAPIHSYLPLQRRKQVFLQSFSKLKPDYTAPYTRIYHLLGMYAYLFSLLCSRQLLNYTYPNDAPNLLH